MINMLSESDVTAKIQQLEKEAKEQDKLYRDLQKFAVSLEKENAIYKSENEMLRESFKHVEDMSFEVYKENTDLKSKLANIKTLNREVVEKIIIILEETIDDNQIEPEDKNKAITAICSLAIEIDKDTEYKHIGYVGVHFATTGSDADECRPIFAIQSMRDTLDYKDGNYRLYVKPEIITAIKEG
jgi:hypothetical protein